MVATGLYTYDSLPHYFDYRSAAFRPDGIDALEEFFLLDIEDGIAGSGVRPGDPQVRHRQARGHPRSRTGTSRRRQGPQAHRNPHLDPHRCTYAQRARAAAHLRVRGSGPVSGRDRPQRRQHRPRILGEHSSRPGRHSGWTGSEWTSTARPSSGSKPWSRLCDMGWAGQMVLSHDAACHVDWFDEELLRKPRPELALPAPDQRRDPEVARARRHRGPGEDHDGRHAEAAARQRPGILTEPETTVGWRRRLSTLPRLLARPLVVVAATVAFDCWTLRAERTPVAYPSDTSVHTAMVQFASSRITSGHMPWTSWFPYIGLGSPQFLHYQSLASVVNEHSSRQSSRPPPRSRGPHTCFSAIWPICVYLSGRMFYMSRGLRRAQRSRARSCRASSCRDTSSGRTSSSVTGFGPNCSPCGACRSPGASPGAQ